MSFTREDIDAVLERLWENVYLKFKVGDDGVDPHDLYADAALALDMAKKANIPIEELVPNEKDRASLAEYAALAKPYAPS